MIKSYLTLLRTHQYIKNIFILLPIFFGGKFNDLNLLLKNFFIFISFCFIASSVYILNDYHDINEDKRHPQKKYRPLAAGVISKKSAIILFATLLFFGLIIAYFVEPKTLYFISFYFILNIFYSFIFKHIAIVDIFCISIGFVLRLHIGSAATGVSLSMWIIIITFLLALFLALAKRRDDVLLDLRHSLKTRRVIDGYNLEFLNGAMMIMASVIIVSYIMYTVSPEVLKKTGKMNTYMTVVWVILGVLRYLQITFVENDSGSPTMIVLKDKFMQFVLFSWIMSFWLLIYVF